MPPKFDLLQPVGANPRPRESGARYAGKIDKLSNGLASKSRKKEAEVEALNS